MTEFPYATALGNFQNAVGQFGEAAKDLKIENTEKTRAAYDRKRFELTALYDILLTLLQVTNKTLEEYLAMPSADGRLERRELRKQLKERLTLPLTREEAQA